MPNEASFLYDFNSPYAYLAAMRVDDVLPVRPSWRPIAFAFVLRARRRRPWSFDDETRVPGVAECEARAERYGLPPMRWPPAWPVGSYSLLPLRAAVIAADHGLLREFSHAAYARHFVAGASLRELQDVLTVAEQVGLDPGIVRSQIESEEVKDRLKAATDDAIARGVQGVPTTVVGDQLFWGDDRLPDAAAALQAA